MSEPVPFIRVSHLPGVDMFTVEVWTRREDSDGLPVYPYYRFDVPVELDGTWEAGMYEPARGSDEPVVG